MFAALNVADGTVISSLHRRHRTIEFKKFLTKIDATVPAHLDVHLICDNYAGPKPPNRSSAHSHDFSNELTARDNRWRC